MVATLAASAWLSKVSRAAPSLLRLNPNPDPDPSPSPNPSPSPSPNPSQVRQLIFARTDLAIHSPPFEPKAGAAADTFRQISLRTSPTAPLPEDRFLNGFAHIFAGGYAAGYFSYKWAEVLSADGFAAFEEGDLADEKSVEALGRRYARTVMGLGGSKPAAEVFELFRGRGPTATALLRHDGLL